MADGVEGRLWAETYEMLKQEIARFENRLQNLSTNVVQLMEDEVNQFFNEETNSDIVDSGPWNVGFDDEDEDEVSETESDSTSSNIDLDDDEVSEAESDSTSSNIGLDDEDEDSETESEMLDLEEVEYNILDFVDWVNASYSLENEEGSRSLEDETPNVIESCEIEAADAEVNPADASRKSADCCKSLDFTAEGNAVIIEQEERETDSSTVDEAAGVIDEERKILKELAKRRFVLLRFTETPRLISVPIPVPASADFASDSNSAPAPDPDSANASGSVSDSSPASDSDWVFV